MADAKRLTDAELDELGPAEWISSQTASRLIAQAREANRLREAPPDMRRILAIAHQMSNLCYNWSQTDRFNESERALMRGLAKDYDAALAAARKAEG